MAAGTLGVAVKSLVTGVDGWQFGKKILVSSVVVGGGR